MKKEQLSLFEPPRQRRRSSIEDARVFEAVLRLRKSGHQVYTAGRSHQVDGKLLSTSQLLVAATAVPRPKELPDAPAGRTLTLVSRATTAGKPSADRTTVVRGWLSSLIMKVT